MNELTQGDANSIKIKKRRLDKTQLPKTKAGAFVTPNSITMCDTCKRSRGSCTGFHNHIKRPLCQRLNPTPSFCGCCCCESVPQNLMNNASLNSLRQHLKSLPFLCSCWYQLHMNDLRVS